MAESHNLGQKGEDLAADHLEKAGFKILFRNWKWGKNEIDIKPAFFIYFEFLKIPVSCPDY